METPVKVELVYVNSDRGFLGVTVNFLTEPYAVTILGTCSRERVVEAAVVSWLDNPTSEDL